MNGNGLKGKHLLDLLLLLAIWTNTITESNLPSKDGKVWVKINNKYKEGKIVTEGKRMNKWLNGTRGVQHYTSSSREVQRKRKIFTHADWYNYTRCPTQGEAVCMPRPVPFWTLTRLNRNLQIWMVLLWDILVMFYDDEQDQLLMAEWNSINVPVSFDL